MARQTGFRLLICILFPSTCHCKSLELLLISLQLKFAGLSAPHVDTGSSKSVPNGENPEVTGLRYSPSAAHPPASLNFVDCSRQGSHCCGFRQVTAQWRQSRSYWVALLSIISLVASICGLFVPRLTLTQVPASLCLMVTIQKLLACTNLHHLLTCWSAYCLNCARCSCQGSR